MIEPTRTKLLLLKERVVSVHKGIAILKARRLALIREFLTSIKPFVQSRDVIRNIYGQAINELLITLGNEGKENIRSLTFVTKRIINLQITEERIWGLKYKNVVVEDRIVRKADERNYDYLATTLNLESSIELFERILEEMLNIAKIEEKIKRLGNEILKTTRKIKILEERVLPQLSSKIALISQYLSERERETYYRLKIFKKKELTNFK